MRFTDAIRARQVFAGRQISAGRQILAGLNPVREIETVSAHCDIPCGVYDPEQARIEAESCLKIINKYHDSDDEIFRARCLGVKEDRAELAKHHISVLWSDWYKPDKMGDEHHELFNQAVKACSQVKRGTDAADAEQLLELIDQIDELWKKNNGPAETRANGRPG